MDVGTWEDYEQAYWYLKSHPSEYATVVIDTATQLQHIVIQKILTEKNKDTERAGDWGTMTKREWAEVAAVMKTWITNFRDLEMNVVFIAQDRVFSVDEEDQDDDERITPEVGVALSPSVAKHLNASVSVIGNTFIREHVRLKKVKGKKKPEEVVDIQFCLRIGPNPVYTTKIRKPKEILLPDTLVDPTYEDIMEIIKGA